MNVGGLDWISEEEKQQEKEDRENASRMRLPIFITCPAISRNIKHLLLHNTTTSTSINESVQTMNQYPAAAITNLQQREKVDVDDGYERPGKSRTATPIESRLFLTKVPIFFPLGPYILHSSSSRQSNRASCNVGVFVASLTRR